LGEPISDDPERRGVVSHAEMAAVHGDVLAVLSRRVDAGLPRHNAVEP
jgi:hypothetical protein